MKYVRTVELKGYTLKEIKWQTKQLFWHEGGDHSRTGKNQHFTKKCALLL